MPTKVPIIDTLKRGCQFPFQNAKRLSVVGLPAIIFSIASVVLKYQYQGQSVLSLLYMLSEIAFAILLASLVISIHHLILLGEDGLSGSLVKKLWRYALWLFPIFIVSLLITLPLEKALVVLAESTKMNTNSYSFFAMILVIPVIPTSYVCARLSVVLPAAAVGKEGITFLAAWKLTKGNGWRIALLVFFLPYLISFIPSIILFNTNLMITALISNVLMLLIFVIAISLLSYSYEFLEINYGADENSVPNQELDEQGN